MQRFYNQLNAEDRRVYIAWRRSLFAFWGLIAVAVSAVLVLDASVPPDRVAMFQYPQSAPLP